MKTFFQTLVDSQQRVEPAAVTPGMFSDPRDPDRDIAPAPSVCYSLGEQIRRSREGLESNFMSDIIDYDKDPESYDPYADIRSTYDERKAYTDKLNKEKRERHEAKLREGASSVSPNGDPTTSGSESVGAQASTSTE